MNFLDLIIKVNNILNKLEFNLYIKKTQTFQYVPTSSNHPDYIFNIHGNSKKNEFEY
jgi:hypothetical protein